MSGLPNFRCAKMQITQNAPQILPSAEMFPAWPWCPPESYNQEAHNRCCYPERWQRHTSWTTGTERGTMIASGGTVQSLRCSRGTWWRTWHPAVCGSGGAAPRQTIISGVPKKIGIKLLCIYSPAPLFWQVVAGGSGHPIHCLSWTFEMAWQALVLLSGPSSREGSQGTKKCFFCASFPGHFAGIGAQTIFWSSLAVTEREWTAPLRRAGSFQSKFGVG